MDVRERRERNGIKLGSESIVSCEFTPGLGS